MADPDVQALARRIVLQLQQSDVWKFVEHRMAVERARREYKPPRQPR